MTMDFMPELFEKSASSPKYAIDAVIEFELVDSSRAAKLASWVDEHYTAEEQNSYYEFIINVENAIASFGFEITEREQSNRSPSYYFNFIPTDIDGNKMDEITVRFRISDHQTNRGRDNIGVTTIFKAFWFGGEKYEDPYSLILGVEEACRAIQRRDFKRLMEL